MYMCVYIHRSLYTEREREKEKDRQRKRKREVSSWSCVLYVAGGNGRLLLLCLPVSRRVCV